MTTQSIIELVAIGKRQEDNEKFLNAAECAEILLMSLAYHQGVGFDPPWIGYFARIDGQWVGSGGFKGRPRSGRVEIAYGTFPAFRSNGIGTRICKALVDIARQADPALRVCARTLPEESHSTHILLNNHFVWQGTVIDEDDGPVWEWEYKGR